MLQRASLCKGAWLLRGALMCVPSWECACDASYHIVGELLGRNVLMPACRKALRAQAQALAEQPFSREAYARDPKQARTYHLGPLLSVRGSCIRTGRSHPFQPYVPAGYALLGTFWHRCGTELMDSVPNPCSVARSGTVGFAFPV